MRVNLRKCCFVVGLATATLVVAQVTTCHYDGNVQYCENGTGEYLAVRLGASNAEATFVSAVAASATVDPDLAGASATALTGCDLREGVQSCTTVPTGGGEIAVATGEVLSVDCHNHAEKKHCMTSSDQDVLIHAFSLNPRSDDHDHDHDHDDHDGHDHDDPTNAMDAPPNCHTHGGVEHCTGASPEGMACERPDRSYNMRIRVGSLFIVFVTSSIAVFGPILLRRFAKNVSTTGIRFTMIKQFGTGVIIATALIHLLTHASLQFASSCLGELDYEATTTAIVMAGAFLTFLVEFLGGRYIMHRRSQKAAVTAATAAAAAAAAAATAAVTAPTSANGSSASSSIGVEVEKSQNLRAQGDLEMSRQQPPPLVYHGGHGHDIVEADDKLSVWVMEMGIIFHSILIGITTVVSGDSAFKSLLIVIIFHQMFEGLALGSRISTLSTVSILSKSIMATVFACITPLGMMIGILVLKDFNGSNRTTILALGTLDALSAGILIWVGFVEMWAGDWIHGDLKRAGMVKTAAAMGSLVAGMLLMGLLGKWA